MRREGWNCACPSETGEWPELTHPVVPTSQQFTSPSSPQAPNNGVSARLVTHIYAFVHLPCREKDLRALHPATVSEGTARYIIAS